MTTIFCATISLYMKNPKVSVVLVAPQGDANIGAAARAMKNFGITDLRIVNGVPHRTKRAYMWAVDARDVLKKAKTFKDLDEALSDASRTLAFTRRLGRARKRHLDIGNLAAWVGKGRSLGKTALVFGREDSGLTSAEIRRCDAIVAIPTSALLPSINLAQAVLIACYELAGGRRRTTRAAPVEEFVTRREIATVMERMGEMLAAMGYDDTPRAPLKSKILHRLERLFGRGGLTARDVGMFEGLAARMVEGVKCNDR
ncbi:MAG: RNA methyltransferase [Pseudomonadota bacterium]